MNIDIKEYLGISVNSNEEGKLLSPNYMHNARVRVLKLRLLSSNVYCLSTIFPRRCTGLYQKLKFSLAVKMSPIFINE